MKGFIAVSRRELNSYLVSPGIYVFLAMFTLVCGYFFYRNFIYFTVLSLQSDYGGGATAVLNLNEAVFQPVHSNYLFIMLIVVPLITMRLFAEEKKSGTLELLISYPIRYFEVVAAKLVSGLMVLLLGLGLTLLFPLTVGFYGNVEWPPVISSYLGLALAGMALVAIGTFFSSITENQIIAAVLSFATMLLFWALEWTASFLPGTAGRILSQLSLYNHFQDFNRGVLNSNDALFFLNITLFFAAMTLFQLQRRSWRA